MPSIQDFIASAASQVGVSQSAAESATVAILKTFQDRTDSGDFQELLQKIPGASGLLSKVTGDGVGGSDSSGGGMLGGLLGSGASGLGGLGSAAGILALLQKSGLGSDKLTALLPLFLEFAKSEAGETFVNRIANQVPELKTLLG